MDVDVSGLKEKYPALKEIAKVPNIRRAVQLSIAIMLIVAAWNFYSFVEYIRYGGIGPAPGRPPVAEGFLPIAAIVAFKALLATWEIDPIHPAGLIIFIATIATAWLFRRSLCSWICPIGTLSEYLGVAGKRLFGRNIAVPRWLDAALLSIKYLIFLNIAKMLLLLPAQEAIGFMQIPYYSISDIKMFDMFMNLSSTGVVIIGSLMLFSMLVKSFWCRYLCPYGALLGIIGLFSPMMLTKNSETCIGCGICNKACPSNVNIENRKSLVVSAECTGCASCVSVCPKEQTLTFKLFGFVPVRPLGFSLAFLGVFFGIVLAAQLSGHWETNLTIEQYQVLDRMMSGGFSGR